MIYFIVQRRDLASKPWEDDSGYTHATEARGRVRLLRRYGSLEARVVERRKPTKGLPTYNNVRTMAALNAIHRETLLTGKDFA